MHIFKSTIVLAVAGGLLLAVASCKKHNGTPNYNSDKTALNTAIDSLTTVYNNSVEGTKPGDYAVGAREALDSVIQLAQQVAGSTQYTQQQVNNALYNLEQAALIFSNQRLQQVSAANLVAYWTFSGNANDSSGNGHDGTLQTGWVGPAAGSQ